MELNENILDVAKRAWVYARKYPDKQWDEFVQAIDMGPQVDPEDIVAVADEWKKHKALIQLRKTDVKVRNAIERFLKKHSLKHAREAIANYAEILASDYYFDYKWNIVQFFKQTNAAPDFFPEGTKWQNYLQFRDSRRCSVWECPDSRLHSFQEKVAAVMEQYKNIAMEKVRERHGVGMDGFKLEMTIKSIMAKTYPIVFCYIAEEHNLIVDKPTKNIYSDYLFYRRWEHVKIITSKNIEMESINYGEAVTKLENFLKNN